MRLCRAAGIIVNRFLRRIRPRKTDNHHANRRHISRLVSPRKRTMGEMNLNVLRLQNPPQHRRLFALRNGVCGNKSAFNFRAANVFRRFRVPRSDIIQIARARRISENKCHILLLFFGTKLLAAKRRIAENVRYFFRIRQTVPVKHQRVFSRTSAATVSGILGIYFPNIAPNSRFI